MVKLVIHTTADKNTGEYVEAMWETAVDLATDVDSLSLIVHCMDEHEPLGPYGGNVTHRHVTMDTDATRDPNRGTSNDHALCIMDAFSMTGDGNIHVIADSDTQLLTMGWDTYVERRMNAGVGMIGTTYEDLGGFSSGSGVVQTYKRIPNFIFAALNPRHDWTKLDILPNKRHHVRIDTPELSETYNLPMGHEVLGEAGWQVPQYLRDNGITYEGWTQLKPTKTAIVLKGLTDYSEEYHAGGFPFVAHQRGGRKHAFKRDPMSANFFKAVEAHLSTERTLYPKW